MNKKIVTSLLALPLVAAGTIVATNVYAAPDTPQATPFVQEFTVNEDGNVQGVAFELIVDENGDLIEMKVPEGAVSPNPFSDVLSQKDWETLSMKEMNEKFKKAGKPLPFNERDPLYSFRPAEINEFTKEDWAKLGANFVTADGSGGAFTYILEADASTYSMTATDYKNMSEKEFNNILSSGKYDAVTIVID